MESGQTVTPHREGTLMCRGRPVEVLPARPAERQNNMAGFAGLKPAVRACMLPLKPAGRAACSGRRALRARLGVMSCVDRSDRLRCMPCVLISCEAFKACARKPLQAYRSKIPA